MTLIIVILILLNSFILNLSHPIRLVALILVQTSLASVLVALNHPTPWAAIILFLIFVGGLMILFVYTASLASNEKFKFNLKMIKQTLIVLVATGSGYIITRRPQKFNLNNPTLNESLNKIFSNSSISLVVIIITYIFLVMVVVNSIVDSNKTPLRPAYISYDKYS